MKIEYLFNNIVKSLHDKILHAWYLPKPIFWLWLLWPLSFLYKIIIKLKSFIGVRQSYKGTLPVIVVGNITIGGNGKTPAIIALVELLQRKGLRAGVISRGYPINPRHPIQVIDKSLPSEVGDEPLLIYQKTHVPVVVCRNRVKAIQYLESQKLCDVILSDDGLQNTSFKHDIEIVMVDQKRGFGNSYLLPMGPLREPLERIKQVDFVVEKQVTGIQRASQAHALTLSFDSFRTLKGQEASLQSLKQPVYAVTAIANPDAFFQVLTELDIQFKACSYPDHYAFSAADFFDKIGTIIMTEKDAVKCAAFADERFWCLPVVGKFDAGFEEKFLARLSELK